MQLKNDYLKALLKEINTRGNYLQDESIETIYFGGGSPSLLSSDEINSILKTIHDSFSIDTSAEITLEANPDDITKEKVAAWKEIGINRLSLGIQSFYEEDLRWMNRAHTAEQSIESIELVLKAGITNITIDLIYGSPMLTDEKWKSNVDRATHLGIPHLSCYALTVEPKTALEKSIRSGKLLNIDTDKQARQFHLLMEWLEEYGYEHYEISNFAKPGMRSRHNSSYWQQKKYLGVGPSAHSYNGSSRQWNIANNSLYISSVLNGLPSFEIEELSPTNRINEYIMTSLRTSEGINLDFVAGTFGDEASKMLFENTEKHQLNGSVIQEGKLLMLTRKGKLLADGIAADLFFEKL